MKKSLLTLGALAAAAFLTPRAHAGVLSVSVNDGGTPVLLACAGGVNAPITCSGGSANFTSINVGGVGAPPDTGGDLSTITIDATAATGGTHVLGVTVTQTGLSVTGVTSATSTFTVNHLVGGPFGPTTESTQINGAALASATFPATTTNATTASTNPVTGTITSDAHIYAITFTAAGQTATDTIQLVTNAPEPTTVALLGTGLLGLAGLTTLRRRRRQ